MFPKIKDSKLALKERMRKRNQRNPIKVNAVRMVANALRKGHIEKPKSCTSCGCNKTLFGHHSDYSKPLDVLWLCRTCHMDWHEKNGTDLNKECEEYTKEKIESRKPITVTVRVTESEKELLVKTFGNFSKGIRFLIGELK